MFATSTWYSNYQAGYFGLDIYVDRRGKKFVHRFGRENLSKIIKTGTGGQQHYNNTQEVHFSNVEWIEWIELTPASGIKEVHLHAFSSRSKSLTHCRGSVTLLKRVFSRPF
jgi:hypothetical protein